MFNNKSILVTGGTGSFGREFTEVILEKYKPRRMIIFSRDELKQFDMSQKFNSTEMRYFIGDVRDKDRVRQAMRDVDYVVHAAALKQVPAAEYNPMECIKTNIHGAENIISAAIECGVDKVIALSTDKAVNPINLYGATKLASDKLFVAANNIAGGHNTRFAVVRYGNVIGSRGSVLPFFKKLIDEGVTELPITDERMTRFWLSLEEGVEFVIKSFSRMQQGEIFVPKIPSIRIIDLAESLSPGIKTKIIGVRPGEKIHEIMCPEDEAYRTIEFEDHYVITPSITFFAEKVDYTKNPLGEKGKLASENFAYDSGTNPDFLSVSEISELDN